MAPVKETNGDASSAAPSSTPATANPGERKSPDDWARVAYPSTKRGSTEIAHPDYWQHASAAALHGWAEHAHHEGAPIQLTAAEYYGALKAATEPQKQTRTEKILDRDGNDVERQVPAPSQYIPHWPALSKHSAIAKQFAAIAAAGAAVRT